MDRQFDLLLHEDLFAAHTHITHGDSFDLDVVEPYPPIAAVPLPCGCGP